MRKLPNSRRNPAMRDDRANLGIEMEKLSRRDTLKLFSVTSASITMIEAGLITPAQAAREFTWASTGGAWGEHVDDIFVKGGGFDQAAKISSTPSFQLETVAASKVIAARGNPPYDVSDHGEAEVTTLKEADLLLSYQPSLMPNLADIYDNAKMGDYYASTSFLLFGLVWNTKELSQQPADFKELLSAKYKGRIGVPAFSWYGMYWLLGLNKALGGDEDNIDPGITFCAELMKTNQPIIVQNADHGKKLFAQGEIVIAPFWNGIASQLSRTGTPVKFGSVPGTLALGTGFVILKGTNYEKAANEFVDISLNPELQAKFASWNMYPPTNKKAVLPPSYDDIKITEADLANTVKLDWQKVVRNKATYLKRWNQEVLA